MRFQKKMPFPKMKQCSKSNRRRILVIASFSIGMIFFITLWTQLVENEGTSDEVEYEKQYYSDGKHLLKI